MNISDKLPFSFDEWTFEEWREGRIVNKENVVILLMEIVTRQKMYNKALRHLSKLEKSCEEYLREDYIKTHKSD